MRVKTRNLKEKNNEKEILQTMKPTMKTKCYCTEGRAITAFFTGLIEV